uniref:RxLR effector candidate protein n=1 Tax=Hyaloperonospora arabidopsidis (strain Emoy2) TaxID=559515 RepID=M4BAA9_HYAAE|nr:RxLR effector candidate protein [Hyaloperonospora arabidopsidis Emoy2]
MPVGPPTIAAEHSCTATDAKRLSCTFSGSVPLHEHVGVYYFGIGLERGPGEHLVINNSEHCAHRRAPSIPHHLRQLLMHRFQDDHRAAEEEFKRIWFVLSSICQVYLWVERNAAVFRGQISSPGGSASAFWEIGIRQLKAIALREHRLAATALRGARLHACIELLSQDPQGHPTSWDISHDRPPTPALVSWLRTFQTSCSC